EQQGAVRRPDFDQALPFFVASHPDGTVWTVDEHVLDTLELRVERPVEALAQGDVEEGQREPRVDGEDGGQDSDGPEGQPRLDVPRPETDHGVGASLTTKPTPRTVWMSLASKPSSIFRLSRAMCTSITLSSGVARRVSFHTSRASISRETTR